MPILLESIANIESTFKITVEVLNTSGVAVQPTSMTWTLSDESGNLINNRQQETVISPAIQQDIYLTGPDLATTNPTVKIKRILLIEATYNEGDLTGLPYKEEYWFWVGPDPEEADEQANERSTFKLPVEVKNSDGEVISAAVDWTLALTRGATPIKTGTLPDTVADNNIILFGESLAIDEPTDIVTRSVLIEATYTEDGHDGDLSYKKEYRFQIRNLVRVPQTVTGTTISDSDVIADETVLDDATIMGG